MKQLIVALLFLPVLAFAQVGGAGTCHVSGNPNSVSALEVQDMVAGCLTAIDTLTGNLYRYNRTLTVGSRWELVGGGSGVQYSDSLTVFVTPTQLSDSLAAQPQGTVTGTGTTGTIPVWSTTTALGDSPLTVSGTDVTATGTGAFRLPNGTTAQRPTPSAGMVRYNTSNSTMEYYGASAWEVPEKSSNANGLTPANRIPFGSNSGLTSSSVFTFQDGRLNIGGAATARLVTYMILTEANYHHAFFATRNQTDNYQVADTTFTQIGSNGRAIFQDNVDGAAVVAATKNNNVVFVQPFERLTTSGAAPTTTTSGAVASMWGAKAESTTTNAYGTYNMGMSNTGSHLRGWVGGSYNFSYASAADSSLTNISGVVARGDATAAKHTDPRNIYGSYNSAKGKSGDNVYGVYAQAYGLGVNWGIFSDQGLNSFRRKTGIGLVTEPQDTLHVVGTARVTASGGTATTVTGRDANGTLTDVTIGSGLSLTSGTLTATGGSGTWLKPELESGNVTINNGTNSLRLNLQNSSSPTFSPALRFQHDGGNDDIYATAWEMADTVNSLYLREYYENGVYRRRSNTSMFLGTTDTAAVVRIQSGNSLAQVWGGVDGYIQVSNGSGKGGRMRLTDYTNGGGYVQVSAPDTTDAAWTLTLPKNPGTSGQVLQTDGAGVTTWATAGSGGGGVSITSTTLETTPITAVIGKITLVDCSAAARTVTPPSSPAQNDRFAVSDARAASGTNNITVNFTAASQNLYGSAQNYIINANGGYIEFIYVDSTTGWIATKG